MHIFIFFRDFRIQDNRGLSKAMNEVGDIIPIFVFTPEQIHENKNKYFSNNSVQFLCESLDDLRQNIHKKGGELYIFHDNLVNALEKIHREEGISTIHFNRDYTPYAKKRALLIKAMGRRNNIIICEHEDYLLAPVGSFLKSDGKPYTIYTPFRNNVHNNDTLIPRKEERRTFSFEKREKLKKMRECHYNFNEYYSKNHLLHVNGGRKIGLKYLTKAKSLQYDDDRNKLSIETTNLSAYIKYGCLSIREVFHLLKDKNQIGICDQLIWREFYYYIVYYYPEVIGKSANFQPKYDDLEWVKSKSNFEKWCRGETGYPIVDACMRQMNKTGYMHNRGRLIASNFLNRMLGMDWRLGEKYFANMLVDYDPAVNNGNWQWIASTGTDPKPYFQRLFNPWLQSSRFDPNAEYIKKWIPELEGIPAKELHEWDKHCNKYNTKQLGYAKPVVDYKSAREHSIKQYKAVL
jgi:deoxyribodipyrimidine photo-lyase